MPQSHITNDGYKLGSWARERRKNFHAGTLLTDRVAALEALPQWSWDLYETGWQEGLDHLRSYASDTGDARVPVGTAVSDGYKLGSWAAHRRLGMGDGL